ncbi:MAG: serine--tRNA ligase [Thermoanaerobacteraceae bacterium]|nr:serine--tRNA ligase [Thermoanaerobacteraceae bacterium]
MLDIKLLRQNPELVVEGLRRRGLAAPLEQFLDLDARRRSLLTEVEGLRNRRNTVSEEIARLKKAGQGAEDLIAEMREVSRRIKELDEDLEVVEQQLAQEMLALPNLPHSSVPDGSGEEDNQVVRLWGDKPAFTFAPRPHWEVAERLGIIDFERGAKVAGARFVFYRGAGAKLERALINFMLDLHTEKHGYIEVFPPYLVNSGAMMGTGQLPKFAEDMFHISGTDYYLIPTAEVPVTNLYREEILEGEQLPLYHVAYSACFRAEAGAAGRDTRGLIRQHQFNKVELVKFTRPEQSYDELEKMTRDAEEVLQLLGLPYRVVLLCAGDLGFASSKTYDLEVWFPAAGVYREISSCSNCEDFQARRANIRFRPGPKEKPRYVHTLNGSGVAVGRTVAAILENYQQEDGSVVIPPALRPYMGGLEAIRPG